MRLKYHSRASRLLLAAVLLSGGAAAAQDYPSSVDDAVLSAWLEKSTNIAPADVVSVTSDLVVAIVARTAPTTPGGPVRLTLREEVITAGYVDTVGGRSSLMSMEIHCEERRLRMDERRLYAGSNLTGSVEIAEPSAEWVRIPEGSILDEVARASCDAQYLWPLRGGQPAPAPSSMEMAALESAPATLPPGPDAKVVDDEPAAVQAEVAVPETPPVPAPEVMAAADTNVAPPPQVQAEETPAEVEIAIPEPVTEIPAAPEAPAEPIAEVAPTPTEIASDRPLPPAPEPSLVEGATELQTAASAEPAAVETPAAEVPEAAMPAQEPSVVTTEVPQELETPEPPAGPVVEIASETLPQAASLAPSPIIEVPVEMAAEVQPAASAEAAAAETPAAAIREAAIPAQEPPRVATEVPLELETPAPPAGPVFAVQIGAYDTTESAEAAWAALSLNRPVLVEGLAFEIQPARVKGKDWMRGLVGRFTTRQDAAAFCSALAGTEYGCILRKLAD